MKRVLHVLLCRFFGHLPPEAGLARVLNAAVFRCPRCNRLWLVSAVD